MRVVVVAAVAGLVFAGLSACNLRSESSSGANSTEPLQPPVVTPDACDGAEPLATLRVTHAEGTPPTVLQPLWVFAPAGPASTQLSLVEDNRQLYLTSGYGSCLYALDRASGAPRWNTKIRSTVEGPFVNAANVYLQAYTEPDGIRLSPGSIPWILAFDAATGAQRWQHVTGGFRLAAGTLYEYNTATGAMEARDPATGQVARSFPLPRAPGGNQVMHPTSLLIQSDSSTLGPNRRTTVYDMADGRALWDFAATDFAILEHRIADDTIYFYTEGTAVYEDVRVFALERASGQQRWMQRFQLKPVEHRNGSRLLITDELVYVRTRETIRALEADTGVERWRWSPPATQPPTYLDEIFADAERLYVPMRNQLVALATSTGEPVWQAERGEVWSNPVLDGQLIYTFSKTALTAIDVASGQVRASAQLTAAACEIKRLVPGNGQLYALLVCGGSEQGIVVALRS